MTGLAGVGKTALASFYAHRYMRDYVHIGWVDASGDGGEASFAALADDPLRLCPKEAVTVPQRVAAVKQALEAAGGPVLLIFDNVDHPRRWRALVPLGEHVAVLVTTRREDLQSATSLRVDVLPEPCGLKLLLHDMEAPPQQERAAAVALYHEFGGLTLALALAGRLLDRPGARPSSLLAGVRRSGVVVWSERPRAEELLERSPSLTRMFQASVALLDPADEVDAHALCLLKAGGWFAPVTIPRAPLVAAAALLRGKTVGHEEVDDALIRLSDLGLVQLDDEGCPRVHRLVAACARTLDAAPRLAVLDALAEVALATPTDTLALHGLSRIEPHLAEITAHLDSSSPECHLRIALRLAQHYKHVARYADGLRLCERLATALGDDLWASYFYNEGGQVLSRQGRPAEALAHFAHDLAIKERKLGVEHPEMAITLHTMGRALHREGRYNEALDHFDRALHIYDVLGAADSTGAATTLTAWGQSLSRLERHAEALEAWRRALAIKVRMLGSTHPDTAMSRFQVGRGLRDLGKPEGEALMQEAVTELAQTLGAEHPYVKTARTWLR